MQEYLYCDIVLQCSEVYLTYLTFNVLIQVPQKMLTISVVNFGELYQEALSTSTILLPEKKNW